MSDQIPERIQVCRGPHNYLLEEVGVPERADSYEPEQRVVVRPRPSGSTCST